MAKILEFLTQMTAIYAETNDHSYDFKKNANFFAENWQTSLKIVIITLTPDGPCFLLTN
jgi:hypothetical protein